MTARLRRDPGPDIEVFEGLRAENFRRRELRRILARAGLAAIRMKDLRDSFASWLLTAGVNPAWVSKALGHATWAVTANHYAAWIGDGYREPMTLAPGEVPPDLLARFGEKSPGEVPVAPSISGSS